MANTASIIIEVDDLGATNALKKINVEAAKLGPTLQPVQRISEQTFNNIEGGALKARESAALLGEEFGVHVPRALRGVLAESAGIGPALTAAFSGLAVIGFIDIAMRAGEALASFVAEIAGWGEQVKKSMDAQIELNNSIIRGNEEIDKLREAYRLIGLQGIPKFSEEQKIANEHLEDAKKTVTELTEKLKELNTQTQKTLGDQIRSGLSVDVLGALPTDDVVQGKIKETTKKLAEAQEEVKKLGQAAKDAGKELSTAFSKERADAIQQIGTEAQRALEKVQAMISAAAKAGESPEGQINSELRAKQEELAKIIELHGDDERVRMQVATASVAIEKEASEKRIKLLTDEADKKLKLLDDEQEREQKDEHDRLEKLRRMEDETLSIERSAAIAIAPPWERANATIIANYEERIARIRELVKTGDLDKEHAERQQTAALQQLYAERRDELAAQMEGLFDDITSGNIGKRFLQMFKHMVFQMIATWLLGLQQMRGATQGTFGGGGGGILGGILGGIFGGGGGGGGGIFGGGGGFGFPGTGPGGTPPFIGNNFDGSTGGVALGSIAGIGISAGQGAGIPGVTLPAGASSGGRPFGTLLGGILNAPLKIGGLTIPAQLALLGGLTLLTSTFRQGGILAGLGGGLGGALLGAKIGSVIPGIGTAIGAVIGGIAGFFAGIFGHSTKKARLRIEAQIKAQAQKIEDAYNLFQLDWSSSRDQLEQLRQQGVDALRQAGVKDISRSRVGHVDHWIDKAEKEIDATQAERNRRGALVFGPPQFRIGGFVSPSLVQDFPASFGMGALHFASGGAVPAILHAGEFVMRPEAVSRIGRGRLESMNSGGGSGTNVNISITAWDGKSVDQWLRNGGDRAIVSALQRAEFEGRG